MKAKIIKTGKIINVEKYLSSELTEDRQNKYINNNTCKIYKEKELDFNDLIDWEQRRYEISKKLLPIILYAFDRDFNRAIQKAIKISDTLIEELKKEKNESKTT